MIMQRARLTHCIRCHTIRMAYAVECRHGYMCIVNMCVVLEVWCDVMHKLNERRILAGKMCQEKCENDDILWLLNKIMRKCISYHRQLKSLSQKSWAKAYILGFGNWSNVTHLPWKKNAPEFVWFEAFFGSLHGWSSLFIHNIYFIYNNFVDNRFIKIHCHA